MVTHTSAAADSKDKILKHLQGKWVRQAVKSVTLLYIVYYQNLHTLDSTLNTMKARRLELKRLDCENCIELSEPNRCDGGAAR